MTDDRDNNHDQDRERFVLDEPVTALQVRAAARALGFHIGVDPDPGVDVGVDEGGAGEQASVPGPHWPEREVTLLLATLDALVVRCQLDQALRDPADTVTLGLCAVSAQNEVGAGVEDALAAALRRVQSVAGLVDGAIDGATDQSAVDNPGRVVTHLLNTVAMLIAAWLGQHVRHTRSGPRDVNALTLPDLDALVAGAGRTLDVAAGEFSDWRRSVEPA